LKGIHEETFAVSPSKYNYGNNHKKVSYLEDGTSKKMPSKYNELRISSPRFRNITSQSLEDTELK
jgi:hypothetical protein